MGRRPEPTQLKILKSRAPGQDIAGRPIPKPPDFERAAPTCPEHFDTDARELWERIVPGLEQLDLLKPEDWCALVTYCETWQTYRVALRKVRREGLIIKHPTTGMPHKNPAQQIVEALTMQLLRYAIEFGLTPAAESALSRGALLSSDDADDKFGAAQTG